MLELGLGGLNIALRAELTFLSDLLLHIIPSIISAISHRNRDRHSKATIRNLNVSRGLGCCVEGVKKCSIRFIFDTSQPLQNCSMTQRIELTISRLLSCSEIDRTLDIPQALLHIPNEQRCFPALSRIWVYSLNKPIQHFTLPFHVFYSCH